MSARTADRTRAHRIAYDVVRPGVYAATCTICGAHRESRNTAWLSHWGPEHVVTAWEREHHR